MKKRLLCIIICLIVLFSMGGCSDTTDTDTSANRYGGHANIRVSGISGLDPLSQTGYNNYQWTTMIFENALTRDTEDRIQPGVCEYTLSDDQLTLVLWVREGVMFHNGDTVDIHDVEASLLRAFRRYSSIKKKVVPYLDKMELDESAKTLTLRFTENREDILYYLASYRTWCAIMPKEICKAYEDKSISKEIADCIGTGPYKVTDFKRNSFITVSRFDGYVPNENGLTGFAGPKYAYLDSATFWNVSSDKSAVEGLIGGVYDSVDCMLPVFEGAMDSNHITSTERTGNSGWYMIFNPYGDTSVCRKYPSLRKAVMAAIDTEALLSTLTNSRYRLAKTPLLSDVYDTDIFQKAEYMGPADPELAAKYMAQAKQEGWNGTDPVVIVPFDINLEAAEQLEAFLYDAQIPVVYKKVSGTNLSWRKNPKNQWDVYFYTAAFSFTPALTQDVIINTYWRSEEKDTIISNMKDLAPGDPQYMRLWLELAQLWVDDCAVPFLGYEDGTLFHKDTLHNNEDPGSFQRYWFNAYWDDPENHTLTQS